MLKILNYKGIGSYMWQEFTPDIVRFALLDGARDGDDSIHSLAHLLDESRARVLHCSSPYCGVLRWWVVHPCGVQLKKYL